MSVNYSTPREKKEITTNLLGFTTSSTSGVQGDRWCTIIAATLLSKQATLLYTWKSSWLRSKGTNTLEKKKQCRHTRIAIDAHQPAHPPPPEQDLHWLHNDGRRECWCNGDGAKRKEYDAGGTADGCLITSTRTS